ncbi:MAG: hypothetical protein HC896_05975 [Bacteroidales bacterium]|nr:hypothetical protein [Bacteroidales bacterium]
MARKTIAEMLQGQRTLIFNSSKPEIAPKLAAMGIDTQFLSSGEELYHQVTSLNSSQDMEEQEARRAYDIFHEELESGKADAKNMRELVKMASRKDKGLQNRLKLYQGEEHAIEEWLAQASGFYSRLLNEPEFLSSINKFGITAEKISESILALENIKRLRNEAISETGQAQEATRLRNEKIDQLKDYCYELKTIATVALESEPQLLEMLGITVKG